MQTRCPDCLTIFNVSDEPDASSGLVRCGVCGAVFRADPYLPDAAPVAPGRADVAMLTELPWHQPRVRARHRVAWGLVDALALLALIAQATYFYRDALARDTRLRPWLTEACAVLSCAIRPVADVARLHLLETTVAPHPRYANALRIRAAFVNRAGFTQPCPDMEVTLTDISGNVVARRTFTPAQYLSSARVARSGLPPNLVVTALLDLTNPGKRAVGYEIRLVTAAAQRGGSRPGAPR